MLAGIELGTLDDRALTRLRREKVGFIFQTFNLLPILDARENILLPLSIAGREVDEEWFDRLIDTVGIRDRLTTARRSSPAASSSASPSRARWSRARPSSSPTSRPATSTRPPPARCSSLLRRAVDEFGQTVVMVTHDAHAAVARRPAGRARRRAHRARRRRRSTSTACSI